MNINTLRKNYDKLNPKERFAAIVAAASRNDEQEREALLQSAPRKSFSVPHTWGLSDAFQFLSMWHAMNQLGYAVFFYFLLQMGDVDEREIQIEGKAIRFSDGFLLAQQRVLEGCEAWRQICKEYGVDPAVMLEGLPCLEMIQMIELIMRAANQDNPLELTNLQETIDGYREAIEHKRREWE